MLSDALLERLRSHLPGAPTAFAPVGGGCIADGGRLDVGGRSFFLKRGDAEVTRTFAAEAAGLQALRKAAAETGSVLQIPAVHATADAGGDAPGFLLMDWVEPGDRTGTAHETTLGQGLAALHRATSANLRSSGNDEEKGERYGFPRDNFIGRLPQANGWMDAWPAFFRNRRLAPQVERARQNGRWHAAWDSSWNALRERLPALLPEAPPPSMLHGDLWSGNALATEGGGAALIDPAAYYGHRETDLALTELFGGFGTAFYDAYRTAWPLEDGYETRRAVYNLYHLINHLNHFGASYAGRVERVLQRFG